MSTFSAGGRRIELRIPLRGGIDLRLVERPGFMDAAGRDALVGHLRDVADGCVPGGGLRYGVLSGEPGRLERALLAVVYERRTGRPVGFNAMTWLDLSGEDGAPRWVLHAGLCMVVPGYRSRGLAVALSVAPPLLALLRNGLRPVWTTNVTQVPAVAGMFAASAAEVYPAPGRSLPPSPVHEAIAREVLARHRSAFGVGDDAEFDPVRFVIRNAYTGGSDALKKGWAEVTKHRRPELNRLCAELLDYRRGDDLLQVGRFSLAFAVRAALRLIGRLLPAAPRPRRARPPRGTLAGVEGAP